MMVSGSVSGIHGMIQSVQYKVSLLLDLTRQVKESLRQALAPSITVPSTPDLHQRSSSTFFDHVFCQLRSLHCFVFQKQCDASHLWGLQGVPLDSYAMGCQGPKWLRGSPRPLAVLRTPSQETTSTHLFGVAFGSPWTTRTHWRGASWTPGTPV